MVVFTEEVVTGLLVARRVDSVFGEVGSGVIGKDAFGIVIGSDWNVFGVVSASRNTYSPNRSS